MTPGAEAVIEAASKRRADTMRTEWASICNAMADGYWRKTEADALERIAAIKAELQRIGAER